jgi:acetolactate synthase-1/2/3 large subunit
VQPAAALHGDVKAVLGDLNKLLQRKERPDWFARLDDLKREHPSITIRDTDEVLPQYVIQKIYQCSGDDFYTVTGVGQHQMWAAQYYRSDKPARFITSGGLGTMGFEIPAAMGVQVAKPGELVWSICGDGGFQMTLQNLAVVSEHNMPIKFAIINNGYLGMVRQWQTLFYGDRRIATPLKNPDFVKLAEAYDILGLRVTDKHQVESAIYKALDHPGPVIIDFQVHGDENLFPMVPPGAALQETLDLPQFEEEKVVTTA